VGENEKTGNQIKDQKHIEAKLRVQRKVGWGGRLGKRKGTGHAFPETRTLARACSGAGAPDCKKKRLSRGLRELDNPKKKIPKERDLSGKKNDPGGIRTSASLAQGESKKKERLAVTQKEEKKKKKKPAS